MAKSEAEINAAANRYYARVFTLDEPVLADLRTVAREEFGLDGFTDEQMVNALRVLSWQFYQRSGVVCSPISVVNRRRMQKYVDSLQPSKDEPTL